MMNRNSNLEIFTLVYLNPTENASIDAEQGEQLRSIIHQHHRFYDENTCVQFIQSKSTLNRVIVLTAITTVINTVLALNHVIVTYLIGSEAKMNEAWNPTKVIVMGNDWKAVLDRLQTDQLQREMYQLEDLLPFTTYHSIKTNENFVFNRANFLFQKFQKFITRLVSPEASCSKDRTEFIRLCQDYYQSNPQVLNQIDEFQKTYTPDQALSWYTRRTFLYRLFNRAVQHEPNFDMILLLRFFIIDLAQTLNKKRTNDSSSTSASPHLYRTQYLSKKDSELWMNSIGELISIHTFLATSLQQPDPLPRLSDEVESVLIEIDTRNLSNENDPTTKDGVVLMMGSVFRLTSMTQTAQGTWHVQLVQSLDTCDENDDPLALGFILEDLSQWECAEKFYQRLLCQLPKGHEAIPRCYHALGEMCHKQGQFENSTKWLKKALEIDTSGGQENEPNAAMSYHSLAVGQIRKGEYALALKSLKRVMEIWKKSFGDDHLDLAMCYNNMGIAYQEQKKYSDALEWYQKAWSIRQKQLPIEHPLLAQTHVCLGNAHYHLNHYDVALEHFRFAFEIWKRSDTTPYTHLAAALRSMAFVCHGRGDLPQAISYLKESASLYRQCGSSSPPELMQIERLLRRWMS